MLPATRTVRFLVFIFIVSGLSRTSEAAPPGLEPRASETWPWDPFGGTGNIFPLKGVDQTCKCEDPCLKYAARTFKANMDKQWCECKDRDSPSIGCGEIRPRMFSLVGADPQTCRCRDAVTKSKTRSVPVTVSALKFCTSFVDAATQKFNDLQMQARQPGRPPASAKGFFGFSSELTPELCKEVLTGTVERSGTWYTDAAVHSCYLSTPEQMD